MVYLNFFNGELTLPGALALTASQIIILFQSFAADQNNKYGVHEGAQVYIHTAVLTIETIRGQKSNLNPGYIINANPNFIEVGYQGNIFRLRTVYDIVGWIFSVVGNVPDGATRASYYYPLMMIAYVFSKKLVSDIKFLKSDGQTITRGAPNVWMVMWFNQIVNNRLVTRVVLGATLDMPEKVTKDGTKDFRKNLLNEAGIIRADMIAPLVGQGRQDFGHCAESYPLLFIWSLARNLPEIRGGAEGISAVTDYLHQASASTITPYYVRMKNGMVVVNGGIVHLCDNCAFLMGENGFTRARFEGGLERR